METGSQLARRPSPSKQALALVGFLIVSFGAAAVGALATMRSVDNWYQTLEKPSWTPPGSVISAIWNVLYSLMAVSAWLVWRRSGNGSADQVRSRRALTLFGLQLALNMSWSLAFFGGRSTAAGLAVIGPLWLSIVGWAWSAGRVQPLAGWLQVPYAIWVAFAGVLNATVWWRN